MVPRDEKGSVWFGWCWYTPTNQCYNYHMFLCLCVLLETDIDVVLEVTLVRSCPVRTQKHLRSRVELLVEHNTNTIYVFHIYCSSWWHLVSFTQLPDMYYNKAHQNIILLTRFKCFTEHFNSSILTISHQVSPHIQHPATTSTKKIARIIKDEPKNHQHHSNPTLRPSQSHSERKSDSLRTLHRYSHQTDTSQQLSLKWELTKTLSSPLKYPF